MTVLMYGAAELADACGTIEIIGIIVINIIIFYTLGSKDPED